MKTESEVQKEILNYLKYLGAWTVKTVTTNKGGTPDILACLHGKFIAIEVKKPGGKVSPLQAAQIRRIHHSKGIAFVSDSVDEAKRILSENFK